MLIFPVHFEQEFRQGLVPLLNAMVEYIHALIDNMKEISSSDKLERARLKIEFTLQSQQGMYPEWVYEVGFNPGLRAGFRFFLVNLERVSDILFSLNFLLTSSVDEERLRGMDERLADAMKKNAELIMALSDYFKNKKIKATKSDFTSDITALENTLRQKIPGSIELLDLSPDYIKLTALVRDVKDLRELLLQLVLALPS